MTYPWTCINFKKKGPSIFASTTDKSRYLSLKRCKQGRKPGIWAMSVPISNWRFCIWVVFQISNFSLRQRWTQWGKDRSPFAAPLSSSVFCWSHLVIMFFSCKSTRFYTKKRCTRTQYMEFLQDSVTSKLSARHVCGEIDAIKLYISCIPFLISKRIKIHSQFAPGPHKIHVPSPQIGFLEPSRRDPLKGCARRRSATAKLVLGIA